MGIAGIGGPGMGSAVGGLGGPGGLRPQAEAASTGEGANGFAQLLADLGKSTAQADHAITDLSTNGGADLHDIVLSTQMESLSFELAVQIRNRLVDAYSEIFRMQI